MSIRIPCWYEYKKMQLPRYTNLHFTLQDDPFYKGKNVKDILIKNFSQKNKLNIKKMKERVISTRGIPVVPGSNVLTNLDICKLLILCFIESGLTCYYRDSLKIFDGNYYDAANQYIDIDIDELKVFLRSNGLPLPYQLFPKEKGNSSIFKNRLHNKKGLKEILSLDEIKEIVKQDQKTPDQVFESLEKKDKESHRHTIHPSVQAVARNVSEG